MINEFIIKQNWEIEKNFKISFNNNLKIKYHKLLVILFIKIVIIITLSFNTENVENNYFKQFKSFQWIV